MYKQPKRSVRSKPNPHSVRSQPKLFKNPREPITRESLLEWLYRTGWFENHVRKRSSPLDKNQLDDYIQSCWEELCKIPEEKLLEIWYRGKGKFVNYCKALIGHQTYSSCSKSFKENKIFYTTEVYLDDQQWQTFEEDGETNYRQQFPVINRDPDRRVNDEERVEFEYDDSMVARSEINLYEDAEDI